MAFQHILTYLILKLVLFKDCFGFKYLFWNGKLYFQKGDLTSNSPFEKW